MSAVLTLDIGTSSIKVAVVDPHRGIVEETAADLPYVEPGVVDGEQVWDVIAQAIASVSPRWRDSIVGVVASGQGDGLWAVDIQGRGTRDYTWNANFAAGIVNRWQSDGTVEQVYRITGTVIWAGVSAALWRWLNESRPSEAAAIRTVFTAKDWFNYRLTGVEATDCSDATIPFVDPHTRTLSTQVFSLLGCEDLREKIPQIRDPGDLVGKVTAQAAGQTGLIEGTPVYMGALDCVAGTRGAGVIAEHDVVATLGTTSAILALSKDPVPSPEPVGASVLWPHSDLSLRVLGSSSGSKVLEWFLDAEGYVGADKYERFWKDVESGEGHGEIALPFLYGERVPFLSPNATGAFFGITALTQVSDLGRAVIEGIVFSLRDCLESSGTIGKVVLTGGGTDSDHFCQLVADTLGRRVHVDHHPQIGLLGVASYVPGFEALARRRADYRVFEPGKRSEALNGRYTIYKQLVDSLIPIWKEKKS